NDRAVGAQVCRAGPVKGEVGERRLRAPSRGHVEVVDQLLDALADLRVVELLQADEGSHVGVKAGERLSPCPLVLQRSQEVHNLAAGGADVLGGARLNLAWDAVDASRQ